MSDRGMARERIECAKAADELEALAKNSRGRFGRWLGLQFAKAYRAASRWDV